MIKNPMAEPVLPEFEDASGEPLVLITRKALMAARSGKEWAAHERLHDKVVKPLGIREKSDSGDIERYSAAHFGNKSALWTLRATFGPSANVKEEDFVPTNCGKIMSSKREIFESKDQRAVAINVTTHYLGNIDPLQQCYNAEFNIRMTWLNLQPDVVDLWNKDMKPEIFISSQGVVLPASPCWHPATALHPFMYSCDVILNPLARAEHDGGPAADSQCAAVCRCGEIFKVSYADNGD